MWDAIIKAATAVLTFAMMCLAVGWLIWQPYSYIAPVEAQITYLETVCGVWLFVIVRRIVLKGIEL